MNLKKLMYSIAVGTGLMLGAGGLALANGGGNAGPAGTTPTGFGTNPENTTDFAELGGGADQGDSLISVVKNFLNWVLGLLSLIAFGMLLYGGFQMVTAGGDQEGYKKGFTVLKNAAIGLAFIGLSWLIITLIFYVLNVIGGTSA